jgi:hypothetical protein
VSGNQWTLGSIVFGPDRKPVPIVTSQGGKPYNYEALKALQDEVVALRAQLAAAQAALREALTNLREVERHCPCGARPESPSTHPHVGGCPVYQAIRALSPEAP